MHRSPSLIRFVTLPLWLAAVAAGVTLVLLFLRPDSAPNTTLEDGLGPPVATQTLTL